ncbi:hypothetical protein HYX19_01345 [Candidatus Woesearchaeota archaeon]|nr:hypothetical protein [Candidatus Woesearchaeota archaeon]
MIEEEKSVIESIIQETRMNKLIWSKINNRNLVTELNNTDDRLGLGKVNGVGKLRKEYIVGKKGPSYRLAITNEDGSCIYFGSVFSEDYEPLRKFGEYMFVD